MTQPMNKKLRILILEDVGAHAEMVKRRKTVKGGQRVVGQDQIRGKAAEPLDKGVSGFH